MKLMKLQLPISAFWWQLKAWKPEIPRDNARVRKKKRVKELNSGEYKNLKKKKQAKEKKLLKNT